MKKEQKLHEKARAALRHIHNGDSGRELISDKTLRKLDCDGKNIDLEIELGYPAKTQIESFRQRIRSELESLPGLGKTNVAIESRVTTHRVQQGAKQLAGVKNVIAIASGKGGVGKSTMAVNLALALADEGARVGLLDADIYGHSIPQMLGIAGRQATSEDGRLMEPLAVYGIETMSIGFFMEMDMPMVWRSPMVVQTLDQLLFGTHWHDLDYLLIDLPSGTGEVQLSLLQKAPICGALMVTTPQDIALADVKKGFRLLEKNGIALLGIVENMSIHVCPNCGYAEHIFGSGGGEQISEELDVDCLGWLPLDIQIRQFIDNGQPTLISAPDSRIADIYRSVARKMTARLALRPEEMDESLPAFIPTQEVAASPIAA
ncbi:MAG: iron-sulfur cluster carrier protein ApbC [Zoogloeaceae bacterium]|jgi:ATP-binding protein involved in chromosome partitioning|nr:iron-sulfur cluster carrier protein ApbC [Zoogloeaceae bacterium]